MADQDTQVSRDLGELRGLLMGINQRMESHGAQLIRMEDQLRRDIEGVDTRLGERLAEVDGRLRSVEKGAAVAGAVTGGVMAVAVGLIKAGLKIG